MDCLTSNREGSGFAASAAEEIEQLLERIRPRDARVVPDNLVVRDSMSAAETLDLSHPFDQAIFQAASRMDGLKGKVIGFDLDDTLLNTNYICKEAWRFPQEFGDEPSTIESIHYRRLRRSPGFWLKGGWKRPRRMQFDSSRYPFLRNPDVVAQLRPGALAMLHGLKAAGATLVLMTVCAHQRLEFLFSRLPALKDAFRSPDDDHVLVASAKELAEFVRSLQNAMPALPGGIDADMQTCWEGGLQAHREAPACFNVKTLPALYTITGLGRLDLLVDDSSDGSRRSARCGLSDTYLQAPALDPHGPVIPELLNRINLRFGGERERTIEPAELRPRLAEAYVWLRFEDPLYFPFVHVKDTLSF